MAHNQFNRFAQNPTSLDITRTRLPRPNTFSTTFNGGQLIPMYVEHLVPGDTVSMSTSFVCRMSTPIFPVMDNAYLDYYYFFVPYRLVWEHAKEFFGESQKAFAPAVEYTVPQLNISENFKGSILHQMGLPYRKSPSASYSVSALPLRAYGLVWNEWFRDQNVSDPLLIDLGDSTISINHPGTMGTAYGFDGPGFASMVTSWQSLNVCLPVAKYHDYFTSALPLPQKGPAVTLPLSIFDEGLPVTPTESRHNLSVSSLIWSDVDSPTEHPNGVLRTNQFGLTEVNEDTNYADRKFLTPSNLWVESQYMQAVSVNTLRQAFALQKLYEKDARGGTRYREIIKAHFGVTSPDARMQIPEYLAGRRVPINVMQVLQTSESTDTSPQGNTAAFSLTQDKASSFTYSATEHGILLGLMCVRTNQTYSQGIEKSWLRKRRYDFYWPVFANLGEQPVFTDELYLASNVGISDVVFGYQEAWADMRYKPNRVSGALDPAVPNPIDEWTYANHFTSRPTLSPQFIYENRNNIDRTLAIQSSVEDQFIINMYFDATYVRPLPMYSIPGLIDHH